MRSVWAAAAVTIVVAFALDLAEVKAPAVVRIPVTVAVFAAAYFLAARIVPPRR